MSDIFISYAREDLGRAKRLAEALEAHGWSVFWDRYIPPGKTWREIIAKALHEARCVIVAWSRASIASGWVYEEAEEGHERKILMPVFFEEVRPPMGFRGIQAASLVNWEGCPTTEEFQQLISAIADILGSPKQPAEPRSPPQVFEPVPAHKLESAAPRESLRESGRKGQRSILWIAGLALGVVAGLMAIQVWGPESTQRVKPVMETPEVRRGGAPPEPQPEEAETARKGVGIIGSPIVSAPIVSESKVVSIKHVSIKPIGALKLGASTNISLAQNEHAILIDGKIAPGEEFGLGIDDSMQKRNWLSEAIDSLELKYPGNLHWAALFITVGEPVEPPRPGQDFSAYRTLQVQMKGETGGECVKVGIKDNNDPDNGKEPKSSVTLESSWKTYDFDIRNDFDMPREKIRHSPLDMKKLYVLTELVFPCREKNKSQTVYVKNIRFVR